MASSPWFFQFARIFLGPGILLPFLVWGCWAVLDKNSIRGAFFAGSLLAGTMYTYPPARVQVTLFFSFSWRFILTLACTIFVITLLLVHITLTDQAFLE